MSSLEQENTKNETKDNGNLRFYYQTEAEYLLDRGYYHFILESELIQPSLMFCKDKLNDEGKETTLESYVLEIFDPTLPRYRMKKRLSDYVKYLYDEGSKWQEQTTTEKLPVILFACPRTTDLIYVKRRTRKLIADAWEWQDEVRPRIAFTIIEKLKQSGMFGGGVWEGLVTRNNFCTLY